MTELDSQPSTGFGEALRDVLATPEERRLRRDLRIAKAENRKLQWNCERMERDRAQLVRKNGEQERELQSLRRIVAALTGGEEEEEAPGEGVIGFR